MLVNCNFNNNNRYLYCTPDSFKVHLKLEKYNRPYGREAISYRHPTVSGVKLSQTKKNKY